MRLRAESTSTVSSFRETYAADRKTGRARSLGDYLRLFPGDEHALAEQFLALERDREVTPSAAKPARAPQRDRISHYVLLREIGRGGQGRVYLAEDSRFRRRVAVKILDVDPARADDRFAAFRREAETVSALEHPGICPLYDCDVENGLAYIVMRHVEGQSLAQIIRRGRFGPELAAGDESAFVSLSGDDDAVEGEETPIGSTLPGGAELRSRIALVEKVARALHAAHEAGVIHRDVKPANIVVSQDGSPVVLDFGMARRLGDGAPDAGEARIVYGTPAYMAPEQIRGNVEAIDRRTDVHALGVVLFECLTLTRPFVGRTRADLRRAILTDSPPSARSLNAAAPADIDLVLARALEKDPDRRYATALEFADDLRRVLAYEPVTAYAVSWPTRLARWCRRNPVLAASQGLIFLLLVVALGVTASWLISEADHNAELADTLAEVRHERDLKNEAIAALEEERRAKDAYYQLAVDLLDRLIGNGEADASGVPRGILQSLSLDGQRISGTPPGAALGMSAAMEDPRPARGLELRSPRCNIVEATPTFRIEARGALPEGRPRGVLALRREDGVEIEVAVQADVSADGSAEIRLPTDMPLSPGYGYRWRLTLDCKDAAGKTVRLAETRPAQFRLVSKVDCDRVLDAAPRSGDLTADLLNSARALLDGGFAQEALNRLNDLAEPADVSTRVLALYLRGRALAMLGDFERVRELRNRLGK